VHRFSTVVFDVGGTLLRFDVEGLARAYVQAASAIGVRIDFQRAVGVLRALETELPQRTQQRLLSLEQDYGRSFWDDFYAEGFRRLGIEDDVSAAAAEIRDHFLRAEFETIFDDVFPTLDALSSRRLKLGILSNFSPNCENVLEKVGIHDYFAFFVVSAIVGCEKPDRRIFDLTVAAADSAREDIVYVGDSIFHDIEGARNAGIAGILIDRRDQHPTHAGPRIVDLKELTRFVDAAENNSR
jgi:REG-2-like HAD superfamily hydrolase